MSAFNYITFTETCIYCQKSTEFEVQTHMASSFNGNEDGRFCNKYYHLGQKMKWWTSEHPEFDDWVDLDAKQTDNNTYLEQCYGSCKDCKKKLIAIVEFKTLTPMAVIEIQADDI